MSQNRVFPLNLNGKRQTTPAAKKTWAEAVKSGGINVQIVLGNGNLGLTTSPTRKGERPAGAARRLRKKEGEGERGEEKRGRAGPGFQWAKSQETPAEELREERRVGAQVARRLFNFALVLFLLCGGSKGGKMVKNGRARVEEMGDRPGEVASERTGLLGSDDAR
ncbi:hypothetical protein BZA77DRAFT_359718 [Pyronema omphalodes]|nr:hypothetical protein BZA77DRAFT_359718 [Pyronema omphalodes]